MNTRAKSTIFRSPRDRTVWVKRGTPNGSVYSDRLYQWDWDKYNALRMKHFGDRAQYWYGADPETVEAFLRDYNNEPTLELMEILQGTNASSGYPYWVFLYQVEEIG